MRVIFLRKARVTLLACLSLAMLGMPLQSVAGGSQQQLERRIAELERMLREVKQEQAELAAKDQQQDEEIASKTGGGFNLSPSKSKLSFYGSIRPALTYFDARVNDIHGFNYEIVDPTDPNSSVEVTDFFTRIGIKGETDVGYGITAFARGEMEVAIDQDGDFDPRLAFAGFKGSFGRVAIGRQWHPHYNTIVEVTDVYNHRSSPFGYDQQGPFRRPNLVTYSNGIDIGHGSFKLDAGVQFSEDSDNVSGGNDNRSGPDSGSVGIAYKNDLFYLGVSYLERKRANNTARDYIGVGAGVNVTDDVYIAATYQDISTEQVAASDDDGHSLDVVGTYSFGHGYKLILGYFDVDEGEPSTLPDNPSSNDYTDGYNVTFQRQLSDNFRIFVEWLRFNYDNALPGEEDTVNAISTGIRYDFSLDVL